MKKMIIAAVAALSCLSVYADANPRAGAEAVAYAAQVCGEGCLILTPRDLNALRNEIQVIAENAYVTGANEALEAVKNNPKICPRNI